MFGGEEPQLQQTSSSQPQEQTSSRRCRVADILQTHQATRHLSQSQVKEASLSLQSTFPFLSTGAREDSLQICRIWSRVAASQTNKQAAAAA